MTRKVKIGFIGCGFMGQIAHLASFARDPRADIVAIADLRPKLVRRVAKHYSIPETYHSHSDLLEKADVEAVVEITQDDQHVPVAIDAIRMGKHVYTEKPLSTNLRDAEKAARTAKRHGVKLQVSYMKRYDPGVEVAKNRFSQILEDESMGNLTFARSHGFGGDWTCNIEKPITTDEGRPEFERVNPDWLPARLMDDYRNYLNVFCHNINLLRHFLGNPGDARFSYHSPSTKILMLEYPDFPALVETGWLSASFWDESTQIYFDEGRITLDTPPPLLRNATAEVEIYQGGEVGSCIKPRPKADWAFRRSAEHFIDCIIHDQQPRSSGQDSVEDLRLIEGAYKRLAKAESA